jgi:hypothetical protein
VNTNAFRAALALCALGASVAVAVGPAGARRLPEPPSMAPVDTIPVLIETQPLALGSPPPTVLAAGAADACNNAALQSYRSVPMPVRYDVSACGTVLGASDAGMSGARVASVSFVLDTDGTDALPIQVRGASATSVQPGQSVLVQGSYFREKSSAEYIDVSHGSVQPYEPPPSPAVVVTASPSSLPTLPPANGRMSPVPSSTPIVPEVAPSPHPAPSMLPH